MEATRYEPSTKNNQKTKRPISYHFIISILTAFWVFFGSANCHHCSYSVHAYNDKQSITTWQFFVPFLGWLSDPFKWLSDLQLGDEKVTLNHLAYTRT